jgi:hypothetical protein
VTDACLPGRTPPQRGQMNTTADTSHSKGVYRVVADITCRVPLSCPILAPDIVQMYFSSVEGYAWGGYLQLT